MFSEKLTHVLGRGCVVWLVIILGETLHGVARRLFLAPFLGDVKAGQIGVFIGSLIVLAITLVFVRWIKASGPVHFFLVGLMWVVLTISFEFILGRYAMGLSWDRIISDYDITRGGLLGIGMLVMLFAPLLSAKLCDEI